MAEDGAALASLAYCQCCALRLEGCTDGARYASAGAACAQEELACGLCLGLLERGAGHAAQLLSRLEEKDFEGRDYSLSITVPVLVVLRQQLLLGLRPGPCVEVKEALRCWLTESLAGAGWTPATGDGGSPVRIGVNADYTGPANEVLTRIEGRSQKGKKRKRGESGGGEPPSAPAVLEALGGCSAKECSAALGGISVEEQLKRVSPAAEIAWDLGRAGLFLAGRYLKLSRRLPQSPWIIDGQRKGESSVEELITGPAAKLFGAGECRFHAEGREDMDVRMLGGGRPFVIELKDSRLTSPSCAELEAAVNAAAKGDVVVRRMRPSTQSAMAELQRDAENHRKTYACVCWSSRALSAEDLAKLEEVKDLEVGQKTPVRVLHRRAPAVRPRTLHWLRAEALSAHYFKLRLSTQAGMYIKEFVHGDMGRTRPSMRSLLSSCVEILQLDVEGLEDDDGVEAPAAV